MRRFVPVIVLVVLVLSAMTHAAAAAKPKISTGALLHNTRSTSYRAPFGAVPAGTPVLLRLRTAHNDVTAVTLNWQEFSGEGKQLGAGKESLMRTRATIKYDWWQATLKPAHVGLYYYDFRVQKGSSSLWYGNNEAAYGGVGQVYHGKAADQEFELTSYVPGFTTPAWTRDAVMYQIFPDRFYNGDKSNDTRGMNVVYGGQPTYVHATWSDTPLGYDTPYGGEDFFGGDLRGIIDKLPYIQSLGVNTLYLNPIFLAPSDHKYDTADYFQIDPRFGTMQDFNDLVAAVHKAGMHLILDGVFNHTSSDSVYFNKYASFSDVGAYQTRSSPYAPWYTFQPWPSNYNTFGGIDTLPQLAESDPVKDFVFRKSNSVTQTWMAAGADGWRLDAATYKSHGWWQQFRQSLKSRFPNDALICECDLAPRDTVSWLLGNELDGSMNYRFRDALLGFFARGNGASSPYPLSVKGFFNALMSEVEEYPLPALYASMNVAGTHDTDRIIDEVQGNVKEVEQVAAFQATWLGAPEIYYGDEAGLTGSGADPLRRKPFPWDRPNATLQAFYSRVFTIRDHTPALRDGAIRPLLLDSNNRVLVFARSDRTQSVAVGLNDDTSTHRVTFRAAGFKGGAALKDALTGKRYTVTGGKVTISLPARSTAILVPQG